MAGSVARGRLGPLSSDKLRNAQRVNMNLDSEAIFLHGPQRPAIGLVLDSPHSGVEFPADFDAAVSEFDLREGEDCFVDQLYLPAIESGIPLLAARCPRTYLDPNRHRGDIDLELLDGGHWPHEYVPSGKARIGKALIWRTLDDGRDIYRRLLRVDEVQRRIERFHAPYHRALVDLLDEGQATCGAVYHLNCHSMNSVAGKMGEGAFGTERADFVLGDRDGTTCDPEFTEFVRATLEALGYGVKVNDPYKGVELVRAYSDPARGRHSLQVEINKRLYMDEDSRRPHEGFANLQRDLLRMIEAICDYLAHQTRRA
ncbi:MAG TPA: N-formylglutamate amidohydrolase [Burkholderiaceae bacterium]|nr:N-formylglutamate amidohydrolase [Burkholderiaceae bacterium]